MCLIPVLKTILFAHKNATSCLIQNSPSRAVSLNGIFGCELAMSSVVIPFSSVLCSGLSDGKMRGYPHLAWLVVPGGQCFYSSQCIWLLVPSVWRMPKGSLSLGCIAELFVGLLTAQFSDIGDLALSSPTNPARTTPPHSSSCPGLQLGIFTPAWQPFLVSQGIQTGAGIALSLWPLYVSTKAEDPTLLSFISSTAGDSLNWECGGIYHRFPAALDSDIKNPRALLFLFCGAQRRRPSGAPGQGEEELLLRKLRQANNPWLPQL